MKIKLFFEECYGLNVCIPPPANSYDETIIPNIMIVGDGAFGDNYVGKITR